MAWHLWGIKSLPEPMMTCLQFNPNFNKISMKTRTFCFKKINLKMSSEKMWPFYSGVIGFKRWDSIISSLNFCIGWIISIIALQPIILIINDANRLYNDWAGLYKCTNTYCPHTHCHIIKMAGILQKTFSNVFVQGESLYYKANFIEAYFKDILLISSTENKRSSIW